MIPKSHLEHLSSKMGPNLMSYYFSHKPFVQTPLNSVFLFTSNPKEFYTVEVVSFLFLEMIKQRQYKCLTGDVEANSALRVGLGNF